MLTTSPCRHCDCARVRRRGLCWRCYDDHAIRRRYRSLSKFAKRCSGLNRCLTGREPPAFPTDALPGSAGKLRVLQERFAARTALWHPDDAELPEDLGAEAARVMLRERERWQELQTA